MQWPVSRETPRCRRQPPKADGGESVWWASSIRVDEAVRTVVFAVFWGLRGGGGLDLFELGLVEAFGFPEVQLPLGVEPELGTVSEVAREAERHGGAQGALLVDEACP
jgi:hypothetical protein